jgi:hypothetical protein
MHLIYYSHSYRQPDAEINEFIQELMLSEGMTPSLDPFSNRLNAAKPERHLRSTDGMIASWTGGVRSHVDSTEFGSASKLKDASSADLTPTGKGVRSCNATTTLLG